MRQSLSEPIRGPVWVLEAKPTLPDARCGRPPRVGIAVILVTQPFYIISELRLAMAGEVDSSPITGFHLLNFAAALGGLGLSWTQGFRERWRLAAFALCGMLIVSSTGTTVTRPCSFRSSKSFWVRRCWCRGSGCH